MARKLKPQPTPKPRSRRSIEDDMNRINDRFNKALISPESFDRQKAALIKEMEGFDENHN